MRISDWSSDVCSSDLLPIKKLATTPQKMSGWFTITIDPGAMPWIIMPPSIRAMVVLPGMPRDRKGVVLGKSVSVRVDHGGCRLITQKQIVTIITLGRHHLLWNTHIPPIYRYS